MKIISNNLVGLLIKQMTIGTELLNIFTTKTYVEFSVSTSKSLNYKISWIVFMPIKKLLILE